MARNARKRSYSVELVERGELLNLRAVGEAVARSMREGAGRRSRDGR